MYTDYCRELRIIMAGSLNFWKRTNPFLDYLREQEFFMLKTTKRSIQKTWERTSILRTHSPIGCWITSQTVRTTGNSKRSLSLHTWRFLLHIGLSRPLKRTLRATVAPMMKVQKFFANNA